MNIILLFGSLLGVSSIIMGAYVDHSLTWYLSANDLKQLLTALKYQQSYAVLITLLGLFLKSTNPIKLKTWLRRSALLFTVGILLFCLGIYFSVIFGVAGISYLVPVGGSMLMLGWACLICAGLLRIK